MEDEEIKIPEFDEKKFKETEKRKAKSSLISFSFGIIIAVISRFLWSNIQPAIRWPLVFLFGIASIGFLGKILQYAKIDIKSFSGKEWIESIAFYFFTWLAFFILLINPPFYDASPPKIEVMVLPAIQEINENATIFARITDNVGVKNVELNLSGMQYEMKKWEDGIYIFNYSGKGKTNFSIKATDKNGHVAKYNGMLHFQKNVIYSKNESNVNASHAIKIWVLKNISREKYRVFCIVNGVEINATLFGNEGDYYVYKITPAYQGWHPGTNKMKPCVELANYFRGSDIKLTAFIIGKNYTITVKNETGIGIQASPPVEMPKPGSLRTPGFGVAAIVIATVVIVLLRKKR